MQLDTSSLLAPVALWLVMAVLAVVNGVFRETVITPRTAAYPARLISTAMLVVAILLVSWWFFTGTAHSRTELLLVGVVWTVLTVGFEFLVSYVEQGSIQPALAQYDVLAGQVWVLILLALLLSPLVFGDLLAG